ncbi:Uncharacterised protein (plasmid) [Legionella adelaidensis]|uniref:Uncharacterized protein n=1 Tax=Legionella adelaidensis TaxID=45056 RepID=A0A448NAE6_9GAMM|nr:Uncharacterised protein [Legionella adelaidensis]
MTKIKTIGLKCTDIRDMNESKSWLEADVEFIEELILPRFNGDCSLKIYPAHSNSNGAL